MPCRRRRSRHRSQDPLPLALKSAALLLIATPPVDRALPIGRRQAALGLLARAAGSGVRSRERGQRMQAAIAILATAAIQARLRMGGWAPLLHAGLLRLPPPPPAASCRHCSMLPSFRQLPSLAGSTLQPAWAPQHAAAFLSAPQRARMQRLEHPDSSQQRDQHVGSNRAAAGELSRQQKRALRQKRAKLFKRAAVQVRVGPGIRWTCMQGEGRPQPGSGGALAAAAAVTPARPSFLPWPYPFCPAGVEPQ